MSKVKIKYASDFNPEFVQELKLQVSKYFKDRNLSKYGNHRLVLKSMVMFAIYLLPFSVVLSGYILPVWLSIMLWVMMGFGMAGVGMGVMHDANHRTFSKNQTVNKWMAYSLFLLGGFPTNWQRQHNTNHHGFTNIDGYDEDISSVSFLRFSPHSPKRKIHRFQHLYAWFFYGFMTILWITTKDFKQLIYYKKEGLPLTHNQSFASLMLTLLVSKILYYVIFLGLPLYFSSSSYYVTLVGFFLMHFTAGLLLAVVFQTAHVVPSSQFPFPDKNGSVENSFVVHQLLNTSDFAPNNKLLTWFIGGLNYQVEHHLFPGISHVHYSKIAPIVRELTQRYGLPYYVQSGFFRALFQHGRMLKTLGR